MLCQATGPSLHWAAPVLLVSHEVKGHLPFPHLTCRLEDGAAPRTCAGDCTWNKGLCRCDQGTDVYVRSAWATHLSHYISTTTVLIRDSKRKRYTGRKGRPHDDRGRDWMMQPQARRA